MEQLIRRLNDQSTRPSPSEVHDIQAQIQYFQRQSTGWRNGLDLLANGEPLMRFYGALTLTIKINADWDVDHLAQNDNLRHELLRQLVDRYAILTNAHDTAFVLRKLCSTLVAYFLQPTSQWQHPVRQVLISIFEHGSESQPRQVTDGDLSSSGFLASLPNEVTFHQLRSVLWLSLSLVEDALRSDPKGVGGAHLTDRITENGKDVWQLLALTMQSFHLRMGTLNTTDLIASEIVFSLTNDELADVVKEVALPTALAWMKFATPDAFESNQTPLLHINRSLGLIVRSFQFPIMADTVLEILTGLAQSAPQYLHKLDTDTIRNILVSPQAETWISALQDGDFSPEAMRYPEFLLSHVELEDLSSPEYFETGKLDRTISILQSLLQCNGAAVVEDGVCQIVLDAFSQIAEGFVDWIGTSTDDNRMKTILADVCGRCIVKAQYPTEEMNESTQMWDASDRSKFKDFRHDVEDFFLSTFSSLGAALLRDTANQILYSTTGDSWESFEAGLYCLGTLSDTMSNDIDHYDNIVSSILGTLRWNDIVQNTASAPSRARQGAINYISHNTAYLQRHQEQLVPCLNFLFSSLQSQTSTTAASRAIYVLCDTQRSSLVAALPVFLATIENLSQLPSEDRHRLYNAVAAVIQAVPSQEDKLEPLSRMVRLLASDFQALSGLVAQQHEEALSKAIDVIQGLAAIGKGLRAPAETAIDLESEVHPSSQYWTVGPGKPIQAAALDIAFQILGMAMFQSDGQVMEAVCDFLKAGYTEIDPSPFRFSADVSAEFFVNKIHLSTPSLSTVMATASAFLASSEPRTLTAAFPLVINAVVDAQRTLLSSSTASQQYADHDFTYSSLDFLVRLLPKWGELLFTIPESDRTLQVVFEFALLGLENPDTLPRRSAAAFWAAVFDLGGYPPTLPAAAAASTLASVVQAYAGRFTAVLLRLLGGECARSELEALAEPLKKFIAKHVALARNLLREAVKDDAGVMTERALSAVGADARMRFVAQVEALRGGRKTNEVVREFWVACRGSAFGYTA